MFARKRTGRGRFAPFPQGAGYTAPCWGGGGERLFLKISKVLKILISFQRYRAPL